MKVITQISESRLVNEKLVNILKVYTPYFLMVILSEKPSNLSYILQKTFRSEFSE